MEVKNRPDVLHHNTKAMNVPSILKHGLQPNEPKSGLNKKVFNRLGVYLSTQRFGWMDWATEEGRFLGAIITLDTNGLEIEPDNDVMVINAFMGSVEDRSTSDFICLHTIPTSNIISIDIQRVHGQSFIEEIISKDLYNKHRILLEGTSIK